MKLERTIEQYRNGVPSVIVEGSKAQVLFALQDSRKDILTLAARVEELEAAAKFLIDRLEEFEPEMSERDYCGHVHPAKARLSTLVQR